MLDRAVLVDESAGEQQIKDDRQEIERDNNLDRCINSRMGSECDQEQQKDQEDIQIIGNEYGEFKLARGIGDIQSSTNAQRVYYPIGIYFSNDRNRQYNSVFFNIKSKGKISFEESDRFDFINTRGKRMDINNKTYRWQIEQGSGNVIKDVDCQ
ncbi:MAG: hypothetical protein EZS28_009888 [Streblomastix strix]|uniref:Uncharacterized protein n=1 Tax=Streblomastix strix TaxID=222440 RepID=A0A5J4WHP8_9EUKA|nr:MAG: hypothetical protein EZS28_009888 [Streblomastix strix]